MQKRGISPIIATVLLISIALILAVIIFLWARSFISEKAQKFGEPIENSCESIKFDAEATFDEQNSELTIDVVNRGDVPIYGLEIRKKGLGSVEAVGVLNEQTISNGETGTIKTPYTGASGDQIAFVPLILGEAGDVKKSYTCDEKYGVETTI